VDIPMPLRPVPGEPVDVPERDHQKWLRLQLVPVSGVLDDFLERRER
jgi:hypothetical protein